MKANKKKYKEENGIAFIVSEVMPDGNGGWQPVPEVLTFEEAVRYLRLDELYEELDNREDAQREIINTFKKHSTQGVLRVAKIHPTLPLFSKTGLQHFIEQMTSTL